MAAVPLKEKDNDDPQQQQQQQQQKESLRIACLLPSATDICIHLGLADAIVGVTHECDVDRVRRASTGSMREIAILTRCGLSSSSSSSWDPPADNPHHQQDPSQGEINAMIQATAATATAAAEGCHSNDKDTSTETETPVESLYPIVGEAFAAARPTLVITQDLCAVCAPTARDVARASAASSYAVLSLHPRTLGEVGETMVQVAAACGLSLDVGTAIRDEWQAKLHQLRNTVHQVKQSRSASAPRPRVLLLEWLDPPFDAGHWIPEMMESIADCQVVSCRGGGDGEASPKSQEIAWKDIVASQPQLIVVACCGFDLSRNVQDAMELLRPHYHHSTSTTRIYAANGNLHFARPGPLLVVGAAVLCQCAYQQDQDMQQAVQREVDSWNQPEWAMQAVEGVGWQRLSWDEPLTTTTTKIAAAGGIVTTNETRTAPTTTVPDIEDYMTLHQRACDAGETSYVDPTTGYEVFTALAHNRRGKCCGSGCRHCPYHHANVKDHLKARRISQPAFLVETGGLFCRSFSSSSSETQKEGGRGAVVETKSLLGPSSEGDKTDIDDDDEEEETTIPVKLLFFSSGKDSFLTLRALIRRYLEQDATTNQRPASLGIILLTTFDAESRLIAHQEVPIQDVIRQATHLQIPLVGVPLHRASSESYVDRIALAVKLVQERLVQVSSGRRLTSLVFGDLHLEHIKSWRDQVLGTAPALARYSLEYPLWKTPYAQLWNDLQASGVPCRITATTTPETASFWGDDFSAALQAQMVAQGKDAFGEEGEFHSLAQVWKVPREQALGLGSLS